MIQTSGERVIWKVNRHWLVPASNLLFSAPLMLVVLVAVLGFVDHLGRAGWPVSLLAASAVTSTEVAASPTLRFPGKIRAFCAQ